MHTIGFPGLGLEFNINPIAIPLPLPSGGIRWYAVIILAGICLALYMAVREAKRLGLNADNLYDMILFALPAGLIFGRAYYCIFNPGAFKDNPMSVFYIWEGGLAIYGGIIGAFLTAFIYCRVKKLNTAAFFDIAALGFMVGQAVGRWGNFVNGEAYGVPTDLPWRMTVDGTLAHPTFLYESLWNVLGFALIYSQRKKAKFPGAVFCAYLVWYGLGRIFIESLRTDSLMFFNLRISMGVSFLAIAGGIVFYFLLKRRSNLKHEM